MGLVDIRDAIATYLDANFTSTEVFFANTLEVDPTNLTEFVRVSVSFDSAEQIEMADNPATRKYGSCDFILFVKATTGQRRMYTLVDELNDLLMMKNIGGVQFQDSRIYNPVSQDGWYYVTVSFPFFAL